MAGGAGDHPPDQTARCAGTGRAVAASGAGAHRRRPPRRSRRRPQHCHRRPLNPPEAGALPSSGGRRCRATQFRGGAETKAKAAPGSVVAVPPTVPTPPVVPAPAPPQASNLLPSVAAPGVQPAPPPIEVRPAPKGAVGPRIRARWLVLTRRPRRTGAGAFPPHPLLNRHPLPLRLRITDESNRNVIAVQDQQDRP